MEWGGGGGRSIKELVGLGIAKVVDSFVQVCVSALRAQDVE